MVHERIKEGCAGLKNEKQVDALRCFCCLVNLWINGEGGNSPPYSERRRREKDQKERGGGRGKRHPNVM